MSSGQKALAEEQEEAAFKAHLERLESIGYMGILSIAADLRRVLNNFEKDLVLPRSGWDQIDRMKELVKRLN